MARKPAPIPAWMFLGVSAPVFREPDAGRQPCGTSVPANLAGLFSRSGDKR
jgi:hypothetical protein